MDERNENKQVLFDTEARSKIAQGVNILADAVKVTLGPRGRNVILEMREGPPVITKDGVSVAKAINLKDAFMNLGVQTIKEVAARTNDLAGDGTTTATVLSQSIFNEGHKMLVAGFSPVDLKAGIDYAANIVLDELSKICLPVKNLEETIQVATISANGDRELGELIATAIHKVGSEGVVTVEEAKGFETTLEVVEGLQIDRGYVSPYFITNNAKMTAELVEPYVLISNVALTSSKEIVPLLEQVHRANKPLLIIADEIEGEALQTLTINKLKGSLNVCAIKAPGFGEGRNDYLGDIAALTHGNIVSPAAGLPIEKVTLKDLGTCRKVIVSRMATTFINVNAQEAVKQRVEETRERLQDWSLSDEHRDHLRVRLAKLSGGVGIIRVGGVTDVDVKERRDRVDDALNATRAAVEEGIVPGGGVALMLASQVLDSLDLTSMGYSRVGVEIVKKACLAPLTQIVVNAGLEPAVVVQKILDGLKDVGTCIGYNAATNNYGDMFKEGIVDPVKVTRVALENARSVAGLLLTVNASVVYEDR